MIFALTGCPGCGHYGVQAAITDAVVAKNIPPEKLAVISGIGCSSRIGGYFYAYGAHTTHGRGCVPPLTAAIAFQRKV